MAKYCIWESRLFLSSGLYKQVLVQKHMSDLISSPSICVLLLMSGSHMAFPLSLRINIFIKTCLHNSVLIYFPGTLQASSFFWYSKLLSCKICGLPSCSVALRFLLMLTPPKMMLPNEGWVTDTTEDPVIVPFRCFFSDWKRLSVVSMGWGTQWARADHSS